MIEFILFINKQGQTRLAKYFVDTTIEERAALEGELVRKCLSRGPHQCNFFEHLRYKVIYRRYASLYIMVGVDDDENELSILEFIHNMVEILDRYFTDVCELDIMYNLEITHYAIDELVLNGAVVDANKTNVLSTIRELDKCSQSAFT